MGPSTSRLQYSPLTSAQVRLLQFENPALATDNIELCLKHYDTEQQIPPYLALSYVWGASYKNRTVRVNGQDFPVTDNLHDALKHIRDLLTFFRTGIFEATQQDQGNPLFWIDTLCIDQGNLGEKSKEVPKMAQIYSKAFTVLVWLGTIQDLGPDPDGLALLLAALEIEVPLSDFQKPQLEVDLHSGLPVSDDTADDIAAEYLKTYARILMNEWFKRVWMLQEYCLSRRQPVVLVGYVMLSLRALYCHAPKLEQIADNPNPEIRNKL